MGRGKRSKRLMVVYLFGRGHRDKSEEGRVQFLLLKDYIHLLSLKCFRILLMEFYEYQLSIYISIPRALNTFLVLFLQ